MKHTFPAGITGTSNDAAGDLFLAGMMRQRDLEDGPTHQEKEIAQLHDDLRKAINVIRALIIEAGGSATISDYSIAEAYGKELIEYHDESVRGHKLSVR